MERRFQTRLDELRRDAHVPPGLLRGLAPRLDAFLRPFVASLARDEQRDNAGRYVRGLLSNLGAKTAEAIAYLHDRDRQGLQKFVGQSPWDHRPLLAELARQVGAELGEPDAVLAFDPSAFAKKGDRSVGVPAAVVRAAREAGELPGRGVPRVRLPAGPRPGRYPAVPAPGVDPEEEADVQGRGAVGGDGSGPGTSWPWTCSTSTARPSRTGGCPGTTRWAGRSWFRRELRARGERYLLAVPSNTSVRDLAAEAPYAGRGRRPKAPFGRADRWAAGLPAGAWEAVEVRDAEKGPLAVQVARAPVQARADNRASDAAEVLVVFRERQPDGSWKHDYLLSNAPPDTPVAEFARVFKAHHRVENTQPDCTSRRRWVGTRRIGYHRHDGVARTGRVVGVDPRQVPGRPPGRCGPWRPRGRRCRRRGPTAGSRAGRGSSAFSGGCDRVVRPGSYPGSDGLVRATCGRERSCCRPGGVGHDGPPSAPPRTGTCHAHNLAPRSPDEDAIGNPGNASNPNASAGTPTAVSRSIPRGVSGVSSTTSPERVGGRTPTLRMVAPAPP